MPTCFCTGACRIPGRGCVAFPSGSPWRPEPVTVAPLTIGPQRDPAIRPLEHGPAPLTEADVRRIIRQELERHHGPR